jgi:hypothetical protein
MKLINTTTYYNDFRKVLPLIRQTLVWHSQIMRNILMRYKILIVFFILVISPTITTLVQLITLPAKILLIPNLAGSKQLFFILLSYQAIGLMWAAIHNNLLFRQAWDKFLLTLPLSHHQIIARQIVVLFAVNSLIWLPFVIFVGCELLKTKEQGLVILIFLRLVLTFQIILLIQAAWINKKYLILSPILVINMLYCLQIYLSSLAQTILLIALITSVIVLQLLIRPCNFGRVTKQDNIRNIFAPVFNFVPAFIKLQWKNLLFENPSQLIIMTTFLIINLIVSFLFIKHTANWFLSNVFMLITVLILSNLYEKIRSQRIKLNYYLDSLAFSNFYFFKADSCAIGSIALIANMPILFFAIHYEKINYFSQWTILLLLPILFLLTTYYFQTQFKRYGFFVSFVLMILFADLSAHF